MRFTALVVLGFMLLSTSAFGGKKTNEITNNSEYLEYLKAESKNQDNLMSQKKIVVIDEHGNVIREEIIINNEHLETAGNHLLLKSSFVMEYGGTFYFLLNN